MRALGVVTTYAPSLDRRHPQGPAAPAYEVLAYGIPREAHADEPAADGVREGSVGVARRRASQSVDDRLRGVRGARRATGR